MTQAASDGSAITYTVTEPLGEDTVGHVFAAQVLSTRGTNGGTRRTSRRVESTARKGNRRQICLAVTNSGRTFLPQSLRVSWNHHSETPQSPKQPNGRCIYVTARTGAFQPLEESEADMSRASSWQRPDGIPGRHPRSELWVFGAWKALTPEALSEPPCQDCDAGTESVRVA